MPLDTYLCDTNVWLALALSRHKHHRPARDWLASVDEPDSIIFCRATQQSFLRLLTNDVVLRPYGNPPLSNTAAWGLLQMLLADDRITTRIAEPDGLEPAWEQYALRDTASPKLWMDAYLAAFASAEGCRLVTSDRAFKQFRGLDVQLLD